MEIKMNYLDFIDSDTVRTHLKSIDYTPDALGAAYIVWQSKSHTLGEKADALLEVIEEYEDMPIPECEYYPAEPSLHAFLKRYVYTEKRRIDAFLRDTDAAAYDYSIYYKPDGGWIDDFALYSDFERLLRAVKEEMKDNAELGITDGTVLIKVRKRRLNSPFSCETLYLTPELEYYKYDGGAVLESEEESDTLTRFSSVCLPIPHPFKVGDTVRECAGIYAIPPHYNDTITVTDFYTEEYIRDNFRILGMHDYSLFGKAKDEGGVEYRDSLDHYLSVEKL